MLYESVWAHDGCPLSTTWLLPTAVPSLYHRPGRQMLPPPAFPMAGSYQGAQRLWPSDRRVLAGSRPLGKYVRGEHRMGATAQAQHQKQQ